MKVLLRNPRREIEVAGPVRVHALLARLELSREAHLVICNGTLVPGDELLHDGDAVEIRPVISAARRDGLAREVPCVPRAGRHRPAAAQRQLLRAST